MTVTVGEFDEMSESSFGKILDTQVERADARADAEAIEKTNHAASSAFKEQSQTHSPRSLEGRVSFSKQTPPVPMGASLSELRAALDAFNPEDLRAIDSELETIKRNPPTSNFYMKLQTIVELMLNLHMKLSEKERVQKDGEKKKFTQSNQEWANFQREVGNRGLNFTWITLGVMALQFAARENDRQFVSFFAKEGCSNIANMYNADTQSKQQMVRAISDLAMAEINAMMNKSSSDSSSKEQILGVLEKASQSYLQATRA